MPILAAKIGNFFQPLAIWQMNNERIETRTSLRFENFRHCDRVQCVGREPVNCFGRQRDHFAAAHLAGAIAGYTWLPVLGVPIPSSELKGLDSLLSTAQMPSGVPVGTLAIGVAGAKNAAFLAAGIIALSDNNIRKALESFRKKQTESVLAARVPK